MSKYTITAASKPAYDEWGWGDHWSSAEWMLYYEKLVEKHGKDGGRWKWVQAFTNPEAPWFGVARAGWLDGFFGDPAFKQFLRENNLWESVNDGLAGVLNDTTNLLSDGTSKVITAGSSLVSSSAKTLTLISKALPIIIIVVIVAFFMYYKKTFNLISND